MVSGAGFRGCGEGGTTHTPRVRGAAPEHPGFVHGLRCHSFLGSRVKTEEAEEKDDDTPYGGMTSP